MNTYNASTGKVKNITTASSVAGPQGLTGPTGPKGEIGQKGDSGEKGISGDKGEVGPKGPSGDVGPKGESGVKGDLGPKGPSGDKGDVGPKGPSGDKGDKGDLGQQGLTGPTGTIANYTGLTYRDTISFSFVTNSGGVGYTIGGGRTVMAYFSQQPGISISHVGVTFAGKNSSTFSLELVDMSGVAFDSSTGGTLIGTPLTNISYGSSQLVQYSDDNTLTTPYTTTNKRPIQIRINNNGGSNSLVILSIIIGFAG